MAKISCEFINPGVKIDSLMWLNWLTNKRFNSWLQGKIRCLLHMNNRNGLRDSTFRVQYKRQDIKYSVAILFNSQGVVSAHIAKKGELFKNVMLLDLVSKNVVMPYLRACHRNESMVELPE